MTKKQLEEQLAKQEQELKELKKKYEPHTPIVYGYCRISTKKQLEQNGLDAQESEIKEKYPTAVIIREQGSGQSKRKKFEDLLEHLQEGDTLVCVKLDRFCRSTEEGLKNINMLLDKGVSIHILNMGLIDNSAMGKLIVTIMLAFAEFEKSLIIERMSAGKEVARVMNPNFKEGRPKKFNKAKIDLAMSLLDEYTYKQVEEMTGISRGTLTREKAKRNFDGE